MYMWEISKRIAEAQQKDIERFSYTDYQGKNVRVNIIDHSQFCVDTDLL